METIDGSHSDLEYSVDWPAGLYQRKQIGGCDWLQKALRKLRSAKGRVGDRRTFCPSARRGRRRGYGGIPCPTRSEDRPRALESILLDYLLHVQKHGRVQVSQLDHV